MLLAIANPASANVTSRDRDGKAWLPGGMRTGTRMGTVSVPVPSLPILNWSGPIPNTFQADSPSLPSASLLLAAPTCQGASPHPSSHQLHQCMGAECAVLSHLGPPAMLDLLRYCVALIHGRGTRNGSKKMAFSAWFPWHRVRGLLASMAPLLSNAKHVTSYDPHGVPGLHSVRLWALSLVLAMENVGH